MNYGRFYSGLMNPMYESENMDDYVMATYLVGARREEDAIVKATSIAIEQTTGSWADVATETDEVHKVYAGKVFGVYEVPDFVNQVDLDLYKSEMRYYVMRIGYPVVNFKNNLPLMLSAITGNITALPMHYVIEFDIKGFFDNVDHSKLIKQIWAMGIRDKHLLWVLKQILKAPIQMPDGLMVRPTKGTPQGGIISPLLANIVLNELDQWIESQWQQNPVVKKYSIIREDAREDHSNGYRAVRKTQLKEMFIVRYADDFRIFCRTKTEAVPPGRLP